MEVWYASWLSQPKRSKSSLGDFGGNLKGFWEEPQEAPGTPRNPQEPPQEGDGVCFFDSPSRNVALREVGITFFFVLFDSPSLNVALQEVGFTFLFWVKGRKGSPIPHLAGRVTTYFFWADLTNLLVPMDARGYQTET